MDDIIKGNLEEMGTQKAHRGWFIGHFIEDGSPFKNDNFEVKWVVHSAGWEERSVGRSENSKTMCVLVDGRFAFRIAENKDVILSKRGDYVFWDKGVYYTSRALEDSILLVIRWPSIGDKSYLPK